MSPGSSVSRALDLKVIDCKFEIGLDDPCWPISIVSAPCAVPVFSSRFKKRAPIA